MFSQPNRLGGIGKPYPSWMGADHADDLQYVFGKPFTTPLGYWPWHRDVSGYMIAYWTNFAKTGYRSDILLLYITLLYYYIYIIYIIYTSLYTLTKQLKIMIEILDNNCVKYFPSIVVHSDPNKGDLSVPVTWPQFTSTGHQYLEIKSSMDAGYVKQRLRLRFVHFWSSILPNLGVTFPE